MAIEKFQFMSKGSVKSFAKQLFEKITIRIDERIVTEINENVTDKQLPSSLAFYNLITSIDGDTLALAERLTAQDTVFADHTTSITEIEAAQTAQDGKLTDIETDMGELSALVESLTHLTVEAVTGSIDTVTEPSTEVLYFQRDDETDTTWMLYIYTGTEWVNIGDTALDLTGYWKKTDVAELREVLNVHEVEPIPDDTIESIINSLFDADNGPVEEVIEDFVVTAENRNMIGYTDETKNFEIPETFEA